jgi:hypothetical protein
VGSLEVLEALFVAREGRLLAQLLDAMKAAKSGEQARGLASALLVARGLRHGRCVQPVCQPDVVHSPLNRGSVCHRLDT